MQGNLFFNEFKDVVMLRQKHRAYDLTDDRVKEMPTAEKQQFLAESDRFQKSWRRWLTLPDVARITLGFRSVTRVCWRAPRKVVESWKRLKAVQF